MPVEIQVSAGDVLGFLLVLARVSGAVAFVPLPGMRSSPEMARVVLALAFAIALFPAWPQAPGDWSLSWMAKSLAAEAAFGLTVGVFVAFLTEGFQLAAQILGLQAGYSYASTIDPNSQADSSVLQVFTQLAASLLFLAFGLHREVIRVFARSLEIYPAGSYVISAPAAEAVLRLGSAMFTTGLRLAMPVVALMLLVDLSLALLGRLNAQLQLLTLAFPAKILASLVLLASICSVLPVVYQSAAERTVAALSELLTK
jgi:flagellar biosynthetic protein FliR